MRSRIYFFKEDIKFNLPNVSRIKSWIKQVALAEKQSVGELNYVFCSDAFLLRINIEYLGHHTLTDVITFDTANDSGDIAGEIYISIDRIRENSIKYKVPFYDELHRVMVHGLLHLLGYSDKLPHEKKRMRKKEFAYLSLRDF